MSEDANKAGSQPISLGASGPRPSSQRAWIAGLALIAAVVIIAAGWGLYQRGLSGETSREIAPGQTLVTAPEGDVVSNFPQEFILEKDPEVAKSYRIEYAAGNVSQPFLRYQSRWNMAENVAAFRDHLRQGGWAVIRAGDPEERPATFFNAARENKEVNIILFEGGDGTVSVSIAYTDKGAP